MELTEVDHALSFYVDLKKGEFADFETISAAAIQWAQAVRAAALAIDPSNDIRVEFIAAEPGSSRWLAKIEQSKANKIAHRLHDGWKAMPLIVRIGIGLAVVLPTTAKPTYDFYLGKEKFSDEQLEQLKAVVDTARSDPTVDAHKRKMYRELQCDPKIIGVGSGVPRGENWRPSFLIPANQFAEAEGLFDVKDADPKERTIPLEMDVILVGPQLENAELSWKFKQEGIPGSFTAIMRDKKFLAALNRSAIREQLRIRIPMKVQIEVRQVQVDGEWKDKRGGRSVVRVLSPAVD